MSLVKVMQRRQVVIPKEVFEQLNLKEGDYLEASVENGKIIYTPKQVVDRDDWYWTEEGQQTIEASLKEAEAGNLIGPYDNAEDLMKELNKRKTSS